MWKWIGKALSRWSKPQNGNRVDAMVQRLQAENRIGDLESELKALNYPNLSRLEQEAWWHLYGVAAFRAGRDRDALERFEEGYRQFPSCGQIVFGLGQQLERLRQIDRAFAIFDECAFPRIPSEYELTKARYAYLWGRYEKGRRYLRSILSAYKELRILDDNFLYIRGLPFFGRWWAHMAAFSALSNDWKELEEITSYVSTNCHDYQFDDLRAHLVALQKASLVDFARQHERRLKEWPAAHVPTGYAALRLGIVRSLQCTDANTARKCLSDVQLTDRDFPWLEDMRLLATAEVSSRFREPEEESQLVQQFLRKQPMLFEPDHALSFHMLAYQEKLMHFYRKRTHAS